MKVPRLGYVTDNLTLKQSDILTNRTARLITVKNKGIKYLIQLTRANLRDLFTIIQWNEKHNIKLYRMSSGLFPHLTNPELISEPGNFKKFAYDIGLFRDSLKRIGDFARKHNHRLTFHPDPFISLGTSNPAILLRNKRELYAHARILDIMNLDLNSIIVIHGGGAYADKQKTMKTWVRNFNKLTPRIKRRLVLENDEFTYSIKDVLFLSSRVNSGSGSGSVSDSGSKTRTRNRGTKNKYGIPVLFDIFHYYCYHETVIKKNLKPQEKLEKLFPEIIKSWKSRRIKMHLAEQHESRTRGAHSEFIQEIPRELLEFPKKYNRELDIMLEAKGKERALFHLVKKYKSRVKTA